jgi:hypothetical protein
VVAVVGMLQAEVVQVDYLLILLNQYQLQQQ